MAPSHDSSDHQDDMTCLVIRGLRTKPSRTPLLQAGGHIQFIADKSTTLPETNSKTLLNIGLLSTQKGKQKDRLPFPPFSLGVKLPVIFNKL